LGSYSLWWTLPDGSNMLWMLGAFGIGFIGAEFAYIFTNAQLPSLGKRDEIGKISGDGFAFGYFGGIVSLMIMLLLFVEQENGKTIFLELDPLFGLDAAQKEGTRSVGPFVALWFLVLIIPYFLWVKEDPGEKSPIRIRAGLSSLRRSLLSLKTRKSFSLYLLSSMFYRDALNGLYSFGGIYAVLVLDWGISSLGAFGIVAGLSAAVFCWLGGFVDRKYGPKPVITLAILILILVCITVVNMSREMFFGVPLAAGSALPDLVFMSCGVVIGGIGGVLQSASRTMMVRHTSPERATEGFGLYGLMGRATAFLAPALIGVVTWLTESPRLGVSPLIFLFIIGLILLRWVNKDGDQESGEIA
jgi:UMF1 family MFS transporter